MSDVLKLWFFRDLNDDQRLKLFGLFGLPVDEIGPNHGRQSMALRHITQKLVEMVRDEIAPSPATNLLAIADAAHAYVDSVSGEPEKDCWDTEDGKEALGAERCASDLAWKAYDDKKQKAFDDLRAALAATATEDGR